MKIEAIICVLVGIGLIFFSSTDFFTVGSETSNMVFLIGAVVVGGGLLIWFLFKEPQKQIIYHRTGF